MATSELQNVQLSVDGHQHTYTARFIVTTDSAADGPLAALVQGQSVSAGTPVPQKFAAYALRNEIDNGAYARQFVPSQPDPVGHPTTWTIEVTYLPPDAQDKPGEGGGTPGNYEPNPVNRESKITLEFWDDTQAVTEAWNVDAFGPGGAYWTRAADTKEVFYNTAGLPLDETIFTDRKIVVVAATKNFATLDAVLDYHRSFFGTVNSDTFFGYAKHKAKFLGVEIGDKQFETNDGADYEYYAGKVRVALNDDEWYQKIESRSLYQYDGTLTPPFKPCTEGAGGNAVTTPAPLTSAGVQAGSGVAAYVMKYRIHAETAYAGTGDTGLGIGG